MTGLASHASLFAVAFLAATILPGSSEVLLAALVLETPDDAATLFITASIANTAGAVVNWTLGKWFAHFEGSRWFPVSKQQVETASRWFRRYGIWSLFLSWFPVIGDALTVVAGALRVNLLTFVVLVAIGKSLRYVVVLWGAQALRLIGS